jgi:hypothetical protein
MDVFVRKERPIEQAHAGSFTSQTTSFFIDSAA